ncbi:DUF1799 domain-containing protein [Tabrizicola sp. SY72]|nr:DUF1799 domain-containing protein [Tabrizicola sp. SY72]
MPTLGAFLAVSGQWRIVSTEGGVSWQGLDYTAVQAGLSLAGITLTPAEWADVQIIEAAATAALNGR